MIIFASILCQLKTHPRAHSIGQVFVWPFLLLLLVTVACTRTDGGSDMETYILRSGAETADSTGTRLFFDSTSIELSGLATRTTVHARSGLHSLRLTKDAPYGFTYALNDAQVDDRFLLEVWVMTDSEAECLLVAEGDGYYISSKDMGESENGWRPIRLEMSVPPTADSGRMKCYVWNAGEGTVYVDDYRVEKLATDMSYDFGMDPLRLYLTPEALDHLDTLRKEAFEKNILVTTDDSWVKGVLFADNDVLKAKVRLKGDWTDHLEGRKWSFRVKLKGENAWKGMRTFSLQTPAARAHLLEWLLHEVAEGEGLLTTRYDFVPLMLGETDLGLYVYEEHFEKQLLESRDRREGPIIKFAEDQFWEVNLTGTWTGFPFYTSGEIAPFGAGRLMSDSVKRSQFKVASRLLASMRSPRLGESHPIDKDKMAKCIALLDVFRAFHGAAWHNMRFYYNPITSQLEPIIYDGYSDHGISELQEAESLSDTAKVDVIQLVSEKSFMRLQLLDKEVFDGYLLYLAEYSAPEFLDSVFSVHGDELDLLETMIRKEFEYYHFDREQLRRCADISRGRLEAGAVTFQGPLDSIQLVERADFPVPDYRTSTPPFMVNVYRQGDMEYRVENFYPDGIEVLGLADEYGGQDLESPLSIPPFSAGLPAVLSFIGIESGTSLLFRVKGHEEVLETEVLPWPSPETIEILRPQVTVDHPLIDMDGEIWTMSGEDMRIDAPIVVPKGKELIITAGSAMDLVNGSFILSYSPVHIEGEAENRVSITSSDHSGMGLTIMAADGPSSIRHCDYSHMNDFLYDRWSLSGALNVYESHIRIDDLHISNNYCEDALNIIRSQFNVTDCMFSDISSDAFDSDFSRGVLSGSVFERVGNDAIDFSGSTVDIEECRFTGIGDKGVSGGEASRLAVRRSIVQAANIGVASKDKSEVILEDIRLVDCTYGLVSFKKKPEYGPAHIIASHVDWEKVGIPLLLEKNSYLLLDKDSVPGKEKNVAARFY